jgi:ubiquinone/menaquinone biosynthesis C-methylase UbiE
MKKELVSKILDDNKKGYDLIADVFTKSRKLPWHDIYFVFNYLKKGDKVLDLGCGSGRLFPKFQDKEVEYFGIDNSDKLIEIAKKENPQGDFQISDGLKLPFSDEFFNKVYSFAVIHHLPSKELRLKLIQETKRVLKKDGTIVLTTWDLWNKKEPRKDVFKNIFNRELEFKDIFIPWRDNFRNIVFSRYIHMFTKGELKRLFKKAGLKVEKVGRTHGKSRNIYIIAKKH